MKHLFIIRHAKSSWDDPLQTDFDRPLNIRGQRDAPFMAKRLNAHSNKPDYIVSSPAVRAVTTATAFASELKIGDENFIRDKRIYEAALGDLFEVIQNIPDTTHSAAIFGHNPGLSHLAAHLSGEYFDMATCSIVHLSIALESWSLVGQNTAILKEYDYPKKHFA
ncbi:MAG: SixA phosphatase family protein [Flavobacteriales bacterium]